MAQEKILCVDDDPNVLDSYQRQLRKRFVLDTAAGPEEGLRAVTERGPFAVVVSDMQMPGMNGIQFLTRVRERAPECVRVMLTGKADLSTSIQAVNEGNVFRFLTKPCEPELFARTLDAAIDQYRLIRAEKELLEKTLAGSVRMLVEILNLVDGEAFGQAQALRRRMKQLATSLKIEPLWKLELAALFSKVGNVTIPPAVLAKARRKEPMTGAEKDMVARMPQTGSRLLSNIPRLDPVAQDVLYQNKRFDGKGFPGDDVSGPRIPIGARLLKVVRDFSEMESGGHSPTGAFEAMRLQEGVYDPEILAAAENLFAPSSSLAEGTPPDARKVALEDLREGQILASDILTRDGKLLMAAGHSITPAILERLQNFAKVVGIREPLQVVERKPAAPSPA